MMYLHTVEYQLVLQAAVKRRHLEETDEAIALHSGVGGKMTVQRFRTANLVGRDPAVAGNHPGTPPEVPDDSIESVEVEKDPSVRGRARPQPRTLRLDYPAAVRLWNYCRKEVTAILQERTDLLGNSERLAANAINSFYRVHESQTIGWIERHKLQEEYFLYKPGFRVAGNLVKAYVRFTPMDNEYLKVTEKQAGKSDDWIGAETSDGFAISKSDRLWLFLREESFEQPRVFCFHSKDVDGEDRVARLFGYLLESDKRYGGGVWMFRVGLVSVHRDREMWRNAYPGIPYSIDEQTDTVRFPGSGARDPKLRVVLDQPTLDYVRPSILKPGGEQVPGGWASANPASHVSEHDG